MKKESDLGTQLISHIRSDLRQKTGCNNSTPLTKGVHGPGGEALYRLQCEPPTVLLKWMRDQWLRLDCTCVDMHARNPIGIEDILGGEATSIRGTDRLTNRPVRLGFVNYFNSQRNLYSGQSGATYSSAVQWSSNSCHVTHWVYNVVWLGPIPNAKQEVQM